MSYQGIIIGTWKGLPCFINGVLLLTAKRKLLDGGSKLAARS